MHIKSQEKNKALNKTFDGVNGKKIEAATADNHKSFIW